MPINRTIRNIVMKKRNGRKKFVSALTKEKEMETEATDNYKCGVDIPSILEEPVDPEYKISDHMLFGENVTEDQKQEMKNLAEEFSDIFLQPGQKLTATTQVILEIPLKPGSGPIMILQYRQDVKSNEELNQFVEKLKFHGIVERSFSPYNHPVFLRPKPERDKDGKQGKRMVVNFVELNKQLIPYYYPLPRIDESVEKLCGKA